MPQHAILHLIVLTAPEETTVPNMPPLQRVACVPPEVQSARRARSRLGWRATLFQAVFAFAGLACAAGAFGQATGPDLKERRRTFTPGELALLPEYCQYQQGMPGRDTPQGRYYQSMLGKALDDIHHYCRGLRDIMFARTLGLKPEQKRELWMRAASEFDYVIKANPPSLVLMPELHYRYGEAMIELGRLAEAQTAFEKSRALKPDYWPAYTRWADFLVEMKRTDEARAILEEGLKQAPDSPELQQRMSRLGSGKAP